MKEKTIPYHTFSFTQLPQRGGEYTYSEYFESEVTLHSSSQEIMNVWAIAEVTEVIAHTFTYKRHAVSRALCFECSALLWAIVVCRSNVDSNVTVCVVCVCVYVCVNPQKII